MKPQLTIEAFADWCEKRPAGDGYNWADEDNCATAQYAKSLGMLEAFSRRNKPGASKFWCAGEQIALRDDYFEAGFRDTFGALAARLRRAAS